VVDGEVGFGFDGVDFDVVVVETGVGCFKVVKVLVVVVCFEVKDGTDEEEEVVVVFFSGALDNVLFGLDEDVGVLVTVAVVVFVAETDLVVFRFLLRFFRFLLPEDADFELFVVLLLFGCCIGCFNDDDDDDDDDMEELACFLLVVVVVVVAVLLWEGELTIVSFLGEILLVRRFTFVRFRFFLVDLFPKEVEFFSPSIPPPRQYNAFNKYGILHIPAAREGVGGSKGF